MKKQKSLIFGLLLAPLIGWLLLSVSWAPAYIVSTEPYPVDLDPGSRGLSFEDIHIPSDDLILEGWWIPADEPRAELIFVHGAGSNRISQYIGSLDFYRTLHELDISVVTMDIRNHGNSPVTDGILRMGGEEWRDVIAAARWLDENHASSLPRILLGASMGGSTVIHALDHGLRAEAAMLLDPQLDVFDSLIHGGHVTTGLPAAMFSVAAGVAIYQFDLPSGSASPLAKGAGLRLPILLIQNWDDPVTRSPYAAQLAEMNDNVTLKRVPYIDPEDSCLDGKEAWGSHVAAHPCHPNWTRATISQFLQALSF